MTTNDIIIEKIVEKQSKISMDHVAFCTGCKSMIQFAVQRNINLFINSENQISNFNMFYTGATPYMTCKECCTKFKSIGRRIPGVIIIPKELAIPAKIITDNGATVIRLSKGTVEPWIIDIASGECTEYRCLPCSRELYVYGLELAEKMYKMLKDLADTSYRDILDVQICRILSEDEAIQLEDDYCNIESLNTPDEKKLFSINVYSLNNRQAKVTSSDKKQEIYDHIDTNNSSFIMMISRFAEMLTYEMSEKSDSE